MQERHDLRFTAHAQVRSVERYLDSDAVAQLRRRGLADGAILRRLSEPFAAQLDAFRAGVRAGAARCLDSLAIAQIPFRLKLGRMRVVIAQGCCLTVLPEDRQAA